jgi:phospholipid transport system substrate-binding protein
MLKLIGHFIIFVALAATLSFAHASQQVNDESSPYQVLAEVGEQLFSKIKQANSEQKASKEQLKVIVSEELVPHVDFSYMSLKILNKQLRKLDKSEVKAFIKAMESHLVDTYANLLTQYNDQAVSFQQEGKYLGKKIVAVKAKITQAGAPDIDLVFKLRKNKKTQQWLVFDVNAEGISLLDSKRSEISGRINQVGFEQVLTELSD